MFRLHFVLRAVRILFLCAIVSVSLASVNGQVPQLSGLSGTVTDISGAVIPGALVLARSLATGNEAKALSDGEGEFRFTQLVPGDYRITATAAGFSPVKQEATVGRADAYQMPSSLSR